MISVSYLFYHTGEKKWLRYNNNLLLAFYGTGGYGIPVNEGMFNSSMHLRTHDDLDLCKKPHLVNLRYINKDKVSVAEQFTCKVSEVDKKHLMKVRLYSKIPVTVKRIYIFIFKDKMEPSIPEDFSVKYFLYGDEQWKEFNVNNKVEIRRIKNSKKSKIHEFYLGISVSPKYDILKSNGKIKDIRFNLGTNFEI